MLFRTKKRKNNSSKIVNLWKELLAFGLFFTLFLLAISLATYQPTDLSWCYYTNTQGEIQNWCGSVGANGAALLFYLCGITAYFFVPLIFFLFYVLFFSKTIQQEWERIIAGLVGMAALAGLLHGHGLSFDQAYLGGGAIGFRLFDVCKTFFDVVGAFAFLYAVIIASFFVVTRLSFLATLKTFYHIMALAIKFFQRSSILRRMITLSSSFFTYSMRALWHICTAWYRAMYTLYDGSFFNASDYLTPNDDSSFNTMLQDFPTTQPEKSKKGEPSAKPMTEPRNTMRTEMHEEESQKSHVAPQAVDELLAQQDNQAEGVVYRLPQGSMFATFNQENDQSMKEEFEMQARILEEKLKRFGVTGSVISIKRGPVVTLFEYQPSIDTKLSKIVALEDDLALALQAMSIRILAPIPGRSVVGFEVANKKRIDVHLSTLINDPLYQGDAATLPLILGHDTIGNTVIIDLIKMPHLLIAGSTGSGKSIALNTMLMSLLCKRAPDEMKLILIDPKRLEFASYADIGHLLFPIVTDPKKASPVLRWVVNEMEERYEKMATSGVRNISDYNNVRGIENPLPFIVVVIDELADLMMTAGRDIEDLIARITQMARAAGIHMIVATQRPSVDVITGLIKVNFPSRISFRVTSKVDSRTILDCNGADKLLGRGDMLFLDAHTSRLRRVHGAYVSDAEIINVVEHIKQQQPACYLDMTTFAVQASDEDADALLQEVMDFLQDIDEISISLLQRKFKIGYNRSARIIELLEMRGAIMPSHGGKMRKVVR